MGVLAALWGVAGVAGILLFAVVRLSYYVLEALEIGLNPIQWVVMVLNLLLMAYAEGYRGFQLRFSPRVAARALYLYRNPTLILTVLAPLFCIGYFLSSRRTIIATWVGTLGIVLLVLLINQFEQPWRGVVDAGVVLGLGWGIVTFLACVRRSFASGRYLYPPEVPPASA